MIIEQKLSLTFSDGPAATAPPPVCSAEQIESQLSPSGDRGQSRVTAAIANATYDAVLANARGNRDDRPAASPAVHLTSISIQSTHTHN